MSTTEIEMGLAWRSRTERKPLTEYELHRLHKANGRTLLPKVCRYCRPSRSERIPQGRISTADTEA